MASAINPLFGGATVAQLYLSAFKAFSENIAIVSDRGDYTYEALGKRSHQIARLLLSLGLKRQDAIAFLVGNRSEAIAAIIAAQLIGLKNVSLHPMASEADHLFVLKDADVKALVVDEQKYSERAQAIVAQRIVARVLNLDDAGNGQGLLRMASAFDDSELAATVEDPAEITKLSYTGGTTGRSKGILHSHRTVVTMVNYLLATYEWPAQIRYLATTPISHAAGALILPTFLRGGTLFLMEKYDAEDFLKRVARDRINCTFLVPTQIYGLLDLPTLNKHDFSSLELILYGAAPIAPARLKEALEKMGQIFGQLYGQAEAPMALTYLSRKDHDLKRPHLLRSCGRVIPGNQVKLLSATCEEVPSGEVGELCVRGPLVMDGYLNRPDENEKVFEGHWLHTGDMARMDAQGYVYIVDRVKDMIISGGFNVFPSEIENCLAQHPDVAMSAVIGIPHVKWGEAVTAIVILKNGSALTEKEVIDYVITHKGVVNAPKKVFFETELPLTALGKVNKKQIRNQYSEM
jgi:fatty-acyl-CoA synthase